MESFTSKAHVLSRRMRLGTLGLAVSVGSLALAGCESINLPTPTQASQVANQVASQASGPSVVSVAKAEQDIEALATAVAEWQIDASSDLRYLPTKTKESSYNRGWVKGAFFIGLERFARETDNDDYYTYLRQVSMENGFELGDRPWHGDDQILAYIYGRVAEYDNETFYIDKSRETFDGILDPRSTVSLEFDASVPSSSPEHCQRRWCWADAIFMAPPAWAMVSRITGDPEYLNFAMEETKATIEYLFDDSTGLIFRDSRYFDRKTPNGKKVMWSRGNGWVFAGLARFIDVVPADHPDRAYLVETFQTMAKSLIAIQRENGYWPTSLLDPEQFTTPETSGSAFFTYGLAWGLNNGIIQGDEYVTARDKGWQALVDAVGDDGHFGWVQQIGADPQATSADSTQLYGSGGFLLAASEMMKAGN